MPGGRGGQVRVRDPRRGDARPQPVAGELLGLLHPCSTRAGRGLHGRHVRAPHRTRRRLPRHARPGRHEPRHGHRRRLPGPRAARRAHRPGRPRADAQGVPSVHRPRRAVPAHHQVERARREPGDHPRGRAQGLQGGRVREARRHAPRAARGRHGRAGRRRAAAAPPAGRARARGPRAAQGRRPHPQRHQPRGPGRQRRRARRRARPRCASSAARPASPWPRRSWARALLDYTDPKALGTVGLQSRDYAMAGFEDADVVIAIGYDLVEHAPDALEPAARQEDRRASTRRPAEIDEYFTPEVELVGDIYHVLTRLAEECRDVPHSGGSQRLRDVVLGRFEQAKDDDAFPMQPPRALWEIRQALGREDILISRRGAAQALDRPHVPGPRAQHRAHRQRPCGHGLRAAVRGRGQARAPGPQGGRPSTATAASS